MAQKRAVPALFEVLETYKGKNIVIGAHGNVMVLMMNYFDETYDFEFWKELDMPDIYKLLFKDTDLKEVSRVWGRTI